MTKHTIYSTAEATLGKRETTTLSIVVTRETPPTCLADFANGNAMLTDGYAGQDISFHTSGNENDNELLLTPSTGSEAWRVSTHTKLEKGGKLTVHRNGGWVYQITNVTIK